ncbi:MAG: hypothetical protein AVDCRST_MAG87-2748 [uncultured Thermomicrobiales bacterium]|uniref:Uncharacterized protein n=1 Tax=uncultured Thermomicrobiales bacterium TaxID=1645740 RepID=A0A6J4VBU2_9BACT|nr:MAG: hypothetical protein AVDCRST_MAG87-2748 [uncultured Thermomicrobiales bacterium]
MVGVAFPNLLLAASLLLVALIGDVSLFGVPVWATILYVPTVVLAVLANPLVRPLWRRISMINLATMAIVFPALVVRQGMIRIPFVDRGNGTLLAPTMVTLVVVFALLIVGLGCAVLSQEDPEFAGVAFLPAAMLVPVLAGQNGPSGLMATLWALAIVYLTSAALTVVASMLVGPYATLVAPVAIAVEFVTLTLMRSDSIFPIGAGSVAKGLFFVVVGVTVTLSILVPMASAWIRQVTRIAQSSDRRLSHQ